MSQERKALLRRAAKMENQRVQVGRISLTIDIPLTVNYKLSIREIITLHYTLDLPTFIHGRKNKFSGSFNIAMVLRVNLNAVNYL